MSIQLNEVDIKQSCQIEESIKNDDLNKSNITHELYDTLTDPECKKSKLSDVWETSQTPPLECQEILKKSDLLDEKVNVVVVNDDDAGDLKKSTDVEKMKLCYRHTDDYEIYHSNIEKDICTEFDNPMYIPIKLPLSSNLYVPVYYVQSSEESSPKLNKHNMDTTYNDNNKSNMEFNNNNNIKSTVSHKYLLISNDKLSKHDGTEQLDGDYHINTSNQGYENYISKYYTSKSDPNHHNLDSCQVHTDVNESMINRKDFDESKFKTNTVLKQKLHLIKPKLKKDKHKIDKEIMIPEDERKKIEKDKVKKTGCSPKLKLKKHQNRCKKEMENIRETKNHVEKMHNNDKYKLDNVQINNPKTDGDIMKKKMKAGKEQEEKKEKKEAKSGKMQKTKLKKEEEKEKPKNQEKEKKTKVKKLKEKDKKIKTDDEKKVTKKEDSLKEKDKKKKHRWKTHISLPKMKNHGRDLSAEIHADAPDVNVSGTLPSVEVPSLKASAHLPTVDVSVPDASLGGDLSGKLDLDGIGVGVVDADLNLPNVQISGNVGAPTVEGDLSMPDVSASLDTDVKLPSVQLTGPDLRVHGEMPDADLSGKVGVPKPHISIKAPKFGFGLGKKKAKVKTPKADVKVEGGGGGKIDLDADLDAHIDGGASKRGKKFHWSPKFGLPKGGLKIGGGAGVGKPDASVSVSGPTGGVDVSLPKPEVDVSLEVPDVDVSASVPKIGVSGGVGKGGELGVSGTVSAPDVDVSVPSKKFTFGWGSKGKKAKKVKLPKVSGDVDAGLDVSGKIDVPSVEVDVDGGARGKGKKFHWSPHISLPKLKMHGPDLSAEIHADAPDVNVIGTLSSIPYVGFDVSDSCLSSEFLRLHIGDSFVPVSSSSLLDSLPECIISPPVFSPMDSTVFKPVVEEPVVFPLLSTDLSISNAMSSRILPRNAFQDIDESFSSPVDSGFNGDISNDETLSAEIDEILIVPIQTTRVSPKEIHRISSQDFSNLEVIDNSFSPTEFLDGSHLTKSNKIKLHSPFHILQSRKHEKESTYLVNQSKTHDKVSEKLSRHDVDGSHLETLDASEAISDDRKSKKKLKSRHKRSRMFDGRIPTDEVISDIPTYQKHCKGNQNVVEISFTDQNNDRTSTPRRSPSKFKDPSIRKTWHGAGEPYSDLMESLNSEQDEYPLTEDISDIYQQPKLTGRHPNDNSLNASDFLRRSIGNSTKRRPWSTLEFPPPGCHFVDDDYLFPDALTPTKIPSFRASKEIVYDVPYMDDKAIPTYEPEWPIGESRRTLISQLSQNSLIRMTAEEESSLISLDTKLIDQQNGFKRKNRLTSHFLKSRKSPSEHDDIKESRSKSLTRLKTWWSKHGSLNK